jgi:hypothetical protein
MVGLPSRRTTRAEALPPGAAIGIVRPRGQLLEQQGHVGVRNCEAHQIDRRGERMVFEPSQQPSAELTRVKPQCCPQASLEKPVTLLRVDGPRQRVITSTVTTTMSVLGGRHPAVRP